MTYNPTMAMWNKMNSKDDR